MVRQDADRLVPVAVRSSARQAEPGPESFVVAVVAEPRQNESCLMVRGQRPRSPAGAEATALSAEQTCDVPHQCTGRRQVRKNRSRAEPFDRKIFCGKGSSIRAPRSAAPLYPSSASA